LDELSSQLSQKYGVLSTSLKEEDDDKGDSDGFIEEKLGHGDQQEIPSSLFDLPSFSSTHSKSDMVFG